MIASTAKLSFYRQSPKKVRQIANIIRGMDVVPAQAQLTHQGKRAAEVLLKLLNSAVANAINNNEEAKTTKEQLFVKEIQVNEGPTLKRFRPRAFGRAGMIRKRTSHITITLGKKKTKQAQVEKKPTKKAATKKKAAPKKKTTA